jgi:hypothetical protein
VIPPDGRDPVLVARVPVGEDSDRDREATTLETRSLVDELTPGGAPPPAFEVRPPARS